VSRCHAEIKYEKNTFFLADNASKFGTLVLIRKQLKLSPIYLKAVQVGRSVINFAVKQCPAKEYKMGEHIKGNNKNAVSLEK
jgi:pSer/pThr/pTyr-binding forkhead associated (FHA) protein